jgi:hypothetical protein
MGWYQKSRQRKHLLYICLFHTSISHKDITHNNHSKLKFLPKPSQDLYVPWSGMWCQSEGDTGIIARSRGGPKRNSVDLTSHLDEAIK